MDDLHHLHKSHVPADISRTKYIVTSTQQEDILRIAAHGEWPETFHTFPQDEHNKIVDAIAPNWRNRIAQSGALQKLPVEILSEFCVHMDLVSLFKFRQTSLEARKVVDALTDWKVMIKHALSCLCALFRTRAAEKMTLEDLHACLYEPKCSYCGIKYGILMNLVTRSRFCYECMQDYAPKLVTLNSVETHLGLSEEFISSMRTFKTLRGSYDRFYKTLKRSYVVVLMEAVRSAYQLEHNERMPATQETRLNSRYEFYNASWHYLPVIDRKTKQVATVVSCAGCLRSLGWSRRLDSSLDITMTYNREDFLKHFSWCRPAQKLWEMSKGGTIHQSLRWMCDVDFQEPEYDVFSSVEEYFDHIFMVWRLPGDTYRRN